MFAKSIHAARPFTGLAAAATVKRFMVVVILLVAVSGVANAYTLVMRNGRRVQVPAKFVLGEKHLTYEAAPGVNVVLLLAVIDIAATERANNEAPGSFVKHAAQDSQAVTVPQTQKAKATVTNRELEPARRARISSEQVYEKRRLELGLPSIEESRRLQAEQEEALLEMSRRRAGEEANSETHWRERASALRNEIVAVDAQIGYLRSRLSAFRQFPLDTHSLVTSVLPLVPQRSRSAVVAPRLRNPGVFAARGAGPQLRGRVLFGGRSSRGQVLTNPGRGSFRLARPVRGLGFPSGFSTGSGSTFGAPGPFDYVEDSYARASLQERLDDLLVTRSGLSARWLQLEDEARTAKVPQVWLEPY